MVTDKFREVLTHEGVVSIVSWADGEAHVVNTWNSYIVINAEGKLLIPAYAMRHTERYTGKNPQVKLTLGAREVMGHRSPGTGFLVTGTARFLSEGDDWDRMKAQFSFLTRVLEVTLTSVKQTL